MKDILNDTTKFKTLGNVDEFDKTTIQEQHIQCELLGFYNEHLIPKKIYEKIYPDGSQRPQLWTPPKFTNKITPSDQFYQSSALLSTTLLSGGQTY